jgi:hypothetical protein
MPAATKKKPKIGRPTLPDIDRKDKKLDDVRFSTKELAVLKARAEAAGKSWTDWVRQRLGL